MSLARTLLVIKKKFTRYRRELISRRQYSLLLQNNSGSDVEQQIEVSVHLYSNANEGQKIELQTYLGILGAKWIKIKPL